MKKFLHKLRLLMLSNQLQTLRAEQEAALQQAIKMDLTAKKFRDMAHENAGSFAKLTEDADRICVNAQRIQAKINERRVLLGVLETTLNMERDYV
jgi:hypothetical protein